MNPSLPQRNGTLHLYSLFYVCGLVAIEGNLEACSIILFLALSLIVWGIQVKLLNLSKPQLTHLKDGLAILRP